MERVIFKILSNKKISKDIYKLDLSGDTKAIKAPGQFVNILLDGFYLRRPISVCDFSKNKLTLIYKVVGKGSEYLSKLKKGNLDILVGLGNGYDVKKSGKSPLLIGGGVGIPPLYYLAKQLIKKEKKVSIILGFNKKEEIFYEKEFKKLGCKVYVTTLDGSYGTKGFVTEIMKKLSYSYFYACGPIVMFKAINDIAKTSGEFSYEERIGCGFGVCMGCSIKCKNGFKRICKDGPILKREEIIW